LIGVIIQKSYNKNIMGRAFEFRKERKFKRWAHMAKTFTRIGREIAMAVKESGADPETNAKLRIAMQNAKANNMPKDTVDRAIQKAGGKDAENYKEVTYEGYGPHKIAIVIETATDNPTRTIANLRSYFNKCGGQMTTSGTFDFLFDRKSCFKIKAQGLDMDEMELDLIDFGLDEIFEEDGNLVIYAGVKDFGAMQKALEERKLEIVAAEFERIPTTTKEISELLQADVAKLLDKIEEDDDVINVYHNMI
jgi:YebC/PmpR family DNA-binding regulatory protein